MQSAAGLSIRRIVADRNAVAVTEFALVAPLFLALVLAIFEVAITLFAQELMQSAAEKSARLVALGTPQKGHQSAAGFQAAVCDQLPALIDCNRLVVDVHNASTLADLRATTPAPSANAAGQITPGSRFDPGGPGSYNVVRLSYLWNVVGLTPTFDLSDAGPSTKLMAATMIVKVEPYNP